MWHKPAGEEETPAQGLWVPLQMLLVSPAGVT